MNSRTAEWFACITFGDGYLLIPQDMILDSFYTRNTDEHIPKSVQNKLAVVNLDEALHINIHMDNSETSSDSAGENNSAKDITTIYIGGETPFLIITSSIPQMKRIFLDECSTFSGIIGGYLSDKGLIAFHFENNKIGYILDVSSLSKSLKR